MQFKFLQNNENVLFNNAIIRACENYYSLFLENKINGILTNRQHKKDGLGTFYITEYEHNFDDDSHYATIIFIYETLEIPKLIFRFKNEKIMCLTLSHT